MSKHAMNISLKRIVEDLISTNREGDFWDFKAEHHDKSGELIKDIICLANVIRHKGDRYIIFGVSDSLIQLNGVPSKNRKTQAQIIDTISKANFASNLYPEISLHEIKIDGKNLDVLIIKDEPNKPFYLQREYNLRGVKLHAGTIYSRVRDVNTARDQVASVSDIERMWRERFGLDETPLQRLQKYLLDFDNWEEIEEQYWYYKPFPEFTVAKLDEHWGIRGGDSWVRAATNPQASVRTVHLKYHQTALYSDQIIYYDGSRTGIPNPDTDNTLIEENSSWFYSFTKDSFKFVLLQFLTRRFASDFDHHEPFRCRMRRIPIIIFETKKDKEDFKNVIRINKETFMSLSCEEEMKFIRVEMDISEMDIDVLKFCWRVVKFYSKWKKSRR